MQSAQGASEADGGGLALQDAIDALVNTGPDDAKNGVAESQGVRDQKQHDDVSVERADQDADTGASASESMVDRNVTLAAESVVDEKVTFACGDKGRDRKKEQQGLQNQEGGEGGEGDEGGGREQDKEGGEGSGKEDEDLGDDNAYSEDNYDDEFDDDEFDADEEENDTAEAENQPVNTIEAATASSETPIGEEVSTKEAKGKENGAAGGGDTPQGGSGTAVNGKIDETLSHSATASLDPSLEETNDPCVPSTLSGDGGKSSGKYGIEDVPVYLSGGSEVRDQFFFNQNVLASDTIRIRLPCFRLCLPCLVQQRKNLFFDAGGGFCLVNASFRVTSKEGRDRHPVPWTVPALLAECACIVPICSSALQEPPPRYVSRP